MPAAPIPSGDPLRVVVVDSDDRTRETLVGLLAIGGQVDVVASAGHADAALEAIAVTSPDVVVVDPRLPDMARGLAFITRVRARWPEMRILAMSSSGTVETDALDRGADRFVRKTYRPTDLAAAVASVDRRCASGSA